MLCSEMNARLARACARGWRQEQLVTELLTEPVVIHYDGFQGAVGYGHVRLVGSSLRNLRKRLIQSGFVFRYAESQNKRTRYLVMTFPEHGDTPVGSANPKQKES